jgi:hypothetical protein
MSKKIALFAVFVGPGCLGAVGAEAKLVRYEINGQTYSYSTNNRQQTKEARQRIEAAAAAEAARQRAATEAAGNPLVKLFGSPAQRQAAEAQARVQQLVAPPGQPVAPAAQPDIGATGSVGPADADTQPFARGSARRERARGMQQANLERRVRVQGRLQRSISAAPSDADLGRQPEMPIRESLQPVSSVPPVENSPAAHGGASVPRERATEDAGSLTDFVNQLRKPPVDGGPPRL